jgi:hypothetical protein
MQSYTHWSEGLNALGTVGNAIGNVGSLRKPGARNTRASGNKTYERY